MATDSPGKASPLLRCLATREAPVQRPQDMRAYVLEPTRYGLSFHELKQAFQTTFPPNTGRLHSAKRRFRRGPGAGVPAYAAAAEARGYALGARGIGGKDAGRQPEF